MSRVALGDVAVEHKEFCKGNKSEYPVVGLEHLIPGEITLSAWDNNSNNSFTKMFRKGNVLFGRRRAYLKKAVVAPFDGICSGDITVIEAKPERILPELLPFIIQNDALFDYAVGRSAGSLSPRVKWEHLKDYEFELPDMEKQKELAEVLWAINDAMEAYKKLISATEELVKSRFIEMFGDPEKQKENLTTLGEHINLINGYAFKGDHFREDGIPVIKIGNVNRIDFHAGSMQFYDRADALERFVIKQGDLLISLTGTAGKEDFGNVCIVDGDYEMYYLNQRNAKLEVHDELNPIYLLHLLRNEFMRKKLIQTGTGIRQCHLHNKDIEGITFLLPPIGRQEAFAVFVRQSDKSKYELEQALLELTATYKRIVAENLG